MKTLSFDSISKEIYYPLHWCTDLGSSSQGIFSQMLIFLGSGLKNKATKKLGNEWEIRNILINLL